MNDAALTQTHPSARGRARRPAPLGAVLVGLALVTTGCTAAGPAPTASDPATSAPTGATVALATCTDAAPVAVDPDVAAVSGTLMETWATSAERNCVPLKVVELGSARAATEGVGDAVAWIPGDASWQQLAGAAQPALAGASATPVATSPLVLVADQATADALGGPLTGDTLVGLLTRTTTWGHLDHPDWGPFKLVTPDITTNAAGALGLLDLTLQIAGPDGMPAENALPTQRQLAMANAQHRIVEMTDATPQVLDHLASVPDPAVAGSAGPRVGLTTQAAALASGKDGLVAWPLGDGTTGVQLAVVQTGSNPAAEEFAGWLAGADGQTALTAQGWTTKDAQPAGLDALGLTAPAASVRPADARTLGTAQALGARFAQRSAILTVLDTSGSMEKPFGRSGQRRVDIIGQLAVSAFPYMPPGNWNGFMTFNTDAEYHSQIKLWMPYFSTADPDAQAQMREYQTAIQALPVGHGTPLYSAILEGYRYGADNRKPGVTNRVIVVTDGVQEFAPESISEAELIAQLPPKSETDVELILVALGEGADFASLQRIADATGQRAVYVPDEASVWPLVGGLLSGG